MSPSVSTARISRSEDLGVSKFDNCAGPPERTSGHLLLVAGFGVLDEQDAGKQRADEQTRTADLLIMSELLNGRRRGPRCSSLL